MSQVDVETITNTSFKISKVLTLVTTIALLTIADAPIRRMTLMEIILIDRILDYQNIVSGVIESKKDLSNLQVITSR